MSKCLQQSMRDQYRECKMLTKFHILIPITSQCNTSILLNQNILSTVANRVTKLYRYTNVAEKGGGRIPFFFRVVVFAHCI